MADNTRKGKRPLFLAMLGLILATLTWLGATRRLPGMNGVKSQSIAMAPVIQGDFEVTLKSRGEVKALRSVTLAAPTTVTEVKLVKLVPNGSAVKAGDVVVEIDATQEKDKLLEHKSSVKQVDAEIEKTRAQGRIQDEQDRLDLAQAKFEVERAKLEVRKQEIVSAIEAGKAKLALQTAERKLAEIEQRIVAHRKTQAADLDQVMQKRKKATGDLDLADQNIQRLTIRSPISGVFNILPNWRAGGFGMQQAPEFKAGDRAWPGAVLAEIPDLSTLVVELFVEETDRGRVTAGQAVRAKVQAISDKPFPGKIQTISALSQANFSSWPPVKSFRAYVNLDSADPKLRPGMSTVADIVVDRLRGVILIPARAAFDRSGKVIAFVKRGNEWAPREITTGEKNETQVVVTAGLKAGETVALEDPLPAAPKGKS